MGVETLLFGLALGSSIAGGIEAHKVEKDTKKQLKEQALREANETPKSTTEQQKVDLTAKARDGMQQSLYAGARKGSIATGGTTLSA